MVFGFNLGSSKSSSQSSSFGFDIGQSFVDPNQQPFLDFLRNSALTAFPQFQASQQGFANQLGGLAGQANPFMGALQQQAGGNPQLVQQQADVLRQNLTTGLSEFGNALRGSAVGAGQDPFSGRTAVQAGVAQGRAGQALSSGLTALQAADAQRAQQASMFGGNLFQQGIGQQAALAGQAFQSQFSPFQALQQLFGPPTVLSQQLGMDTSQSSSRGRSMSFGYTPIV